MFCSIAARVSNCFGAHFGAHHYHSGFVALTQTYLLNKNNVTQVQLKDNRVELEEHVLRNGTANRDWIRVHTLTFDDAGSARRWAINLNSNEQMFLGARSHEIGYK